MLDAGSSHTSLYIYSWPAEKENDTGIVQQIEECKVAGKVKKRDGEMVGHENMRGYASRAEEEKESKYRTPDEEHSRAAIVTLYHYKNNMEVSP